MAERPRDEGAIPAGPELIRSVEELHRLGQQARVDLDLLRLEIATARRVPSDALLLEANEQLVLALLRAQAELGRSPRTGRGDRRSSDRDALTGLPNRLLLVERLLAAVATARRVGNRLAVMFLDIDGFKAINDTHGHAMGDSVLRHAASCLEGATRSVDIVSRHGGDEFIVVVTDLAGPEDAALVAEKILACLAAPERIGDHVVRLEASIGVSIFPDDAEDAEQLIQLADAAMYQAKRDGKARCVFHDESLQDATQSRSSGPALHNIVRHDTAMARQELRQVQLQEANEHLLLAALGAQELQSSAERMQGEQTAFLAVVAHELRNPLTPIRTAASLLCRVSPSELPRLQAVIERQVDHVARLVGDLLDLSRFNSGKLRLKSRPIDFCTLVGEAIDTCRPAMDARLQSLRVDVPAERLCVLGDPVRLVQVLSNLLDNASKYTPDKGEIELTLRAVGTQLELVVTDNGIGIRAEALPTVFHPFVQDTHATDFHDAGLGIGLTVVLELILGHGGTITANSEGEGRGSRFVVTLPLVDESIGCDEEAAADD